MCSAKIGACNLKLILHNPQRPLGRGIARFLRRHFWPAQFWRELRQGSHTTSKFLLSLLGVALILSIHGFSRDALASPQLNRNGTTYVPVKTAELLSKPKAIGVKVGAYFDNLHDLSLYKIDVSLVRVSTGSNGPRFCKINSKVIISNRVL